MSKEKRIFCPFCHELIMPEAKKCRHCGEWLSDKNSKNVVTPNKVMLKIWFLGWVTTMVIFYLTLLSVDFNFTNTNSFFAILLVVDALVGILAFMGVILAIFVGFFKKNERKNSLLYSLTTLALFILFFILLLNLPSSNLQNPPSTVPDNLSSPTPFSSPSPTPTSKTNTDSTNTATEKLNPNDPVHCPVSNKCGGGTKPLKRAECENSVCCEIGDKWVFYTDRDQCIRDQGGNPANAGKKKVPVFLVHNSATVFCPEDNVDAVKAASQQAKDEQNKSRDCLNKNSDYYSQCTSTCWDIYMSPTRCDYWEYSHDSFDSCLSYYSEQYRSCSDSCGRSQDLSDEACSSKYYTDYVNKLVNSLCN